MAEKPPAQPKSIPNLVLADADGGRLAENIVLFARTLRRAGLPVGPAKVVDAIEAVRVTGVSSRKDFYWTLHAVFVNRREQREVFNQAFHVFWRNPDLLDKMLAMLLPTIRGDEPPKKENLYERVKEAMAGGPKDLPPPEPQAEEEEIKFDAALTFSQTEILQQKDFEQMSTAELAKAREALARLRLHTAELPTRRFKPSHRIGRVDMKATLRASARDAHGAMPLKFKEVKKLRPPLVVLCDISGSMDRYARMMLHFLHALTNDRDRVQVFLFGTRLTHITRFLKERDPDAAIERVSHAVEDWSGGTRIGYCLEEFNRKWSRRVLGQGAQVLLITDGLDRDDGVGLDKELQRLQKSARRLVWLNPLLRFDGYAPDALGAKALVKRVDSYHPIHNLNSLEQLAQALATDRLG